MLPPPEIRLEIERQLAGRVNLPDSVDWEPISGGLSPSSVWRVGGHFAVKSWPYSEGAAAKLRSIAIALNQARSAGVSFVAAPTTWPSRESFLRGSDGKLYEAMPWMSGKPLPSPSHERIAVEALRLFHSVVAQTDVGLQKKAPNPLQKRHLLLRQLVETAVVPPSVDSPFAEIGELITEMAFRIEEAKGIALAKIESLANLSLPLQPIHGDARPEHFLVSVNEQSSAEVTGLIDFGAMNQSTPSIDLARLAGELAAGDSDHRAAIAASYDANVNQPLIAALDLSGAVLSAWNWLGWLKPGGSAKVSLAAAEKRLSAINIRLKRLLANDLGK